VSWNLRRLRVKRGWSQEALAVEASVERSYMGRLERAQENPTIRVLERIAAALGVDVVELLRKPARDEVAPKTLRAGRKRR
jgi:transcriptional regulator with XRE-family HTH domain